MDLPPPHPDWKSLPPWTYSLPVILHSVVHLSQISIPNYCAFEVILDSRLSIENTESLG